MYKHPHSSCPVQIFSSVEMISFFTNTINIFVCFFFLFVEYTHFAEISEGPRGYPRLVVNGHMYGVQNYMKNDRTIWKCTKRSCDPLNPGRCHGSATTKLINGCYMARIEKVHRCVRNKRLVQIQTHTHAQKQTNDKFFENWHK